MKSLWKQWQLEIFTALGAFVIYCAVSGSMLLHQSQAPHFILQANAFLHGKLDVGTPPNGNDWVKHDGKWYVSFPTFPAVLMIPFVALNGLAFNDVFFTVCLAALNAGLFLRVLRAYRDAEGVDRPDWQLVLLTAFFAFGSVYFCSAIRGEVWFTAHVVGVTLTLIYLWACLDVRHPAIAGLALGCAAVTRANLAFAFPFFLLMLFLRKLPGAPGFAGKLKAALPKLLWFGAPAAGVLFLALWMNHARWDDWTEFGHGMLYNNRVTARVNKYGLFNVRYLSDNFPAAFLLLPTLRLNPLELTYNAHGMSMFVTTPLLMMIPFAMRWSRTVLALAVTALIISLPGFLYMNDGWQQFGFRFSIDYLPYLFLILAIGRVPIQGFAIVLGITGILVNSWGAAVFNRWV